MAFSDLSFSPQSLSLTTAKCTWVYKYPHHLQQICVEHLVSLQLWMKAIYGCNLKSSPGALIDMYQKMKSIDIQKEHITELLHAFMCSTLAVVHS